MQLRGVLQFPGIIWGAVLLMLVGNGPGIWCVCSDGSVRLHCNHASASPAHSACCTKMMSEATSKPKHCCAHRRDGHQSKHSSSGVRPVVRTANHQVQPVACHCTRLADGQANQPNAKPSLTDSDHLLTALAICPTVMADPDAGVRTILQPPSPRSSTDLIITLHCLLI